MNIKLAAIKVDVGDFDVDEFTPPSLWESLSVHILKGKAAVVSAAACAVGGTGTSEIAAEGYELLLPRRAAANVEHGAAFFMGTGHWPKRIHEPALAHRKLPDTSSSRKQAAKAQHTAQQFELVYEIAP